MPALTHSPADVVRELLIQLGLAVMPGGAGGWPAFVAREPPAPDDCITVFDTTPRRDGRDAMTGEVWFHDGVQLRVRAGTQQVGAIKSYRLAEALPRVSRHAVAAGGVGYRVVAVSRSSAVLALGQEAPHSRRWLWTVNFVVNIEPLEGG